MKKTKDEKNQNMRKEEALERRKSIDEKKKRIVEDPKRCLEEVLLEISEIEPNQISDEILEWCIAIAEYPDEHLI